MTEKEQDENRLPAIGQPEKAPNPYDGPDFAEEHDNTAVSGDITTGEDTDREPESPRGWSGMQR
jgi:hypothetical protein